MRPRVEEQIRQYIRQHPAGEPFVPRDLATCGTRASIDQALGRLTREGLITRVARGVYVRPRHSRIVGPVPVDPVSAVRAYARTRRLSLVPHGAQVLADRGLSAQTPVAPVLGSGVRGRRTVQIVGRKVTLQHVPAYVLRHADTRLAEPLSALAYLGKGRPEEAGQLLTSFDAPTFEALLFARPDLPGWLADLLTRTARTRTSP